MKIKAMSNRIVVKPQEPKEKTSGNIIIPETSRENSQYGEVVSIGSKVLEEGVMVEIGDIVMFQKYSGTEVTMDGEKFLILGHDYILGVIE